MSAAAGRQLPKSILPSGKHHVGIISWLLWANSFLTIRSIKFQSLIIDSQENYRTSVLRLGHNTATNATKGITPTVCSSFWVRYQGSGYLLPLQGNCFMPRRDAVGDWWEKGEEGRTDGGRAGKDCLFSCTLENFDITSILQALMLHTCMCKPSCYYPLPLALPLQNVECFL